MINCAMPEGCRASQSRTGVDARAHTALISPDRSTETHLAPALGGRPIVAQRFSAGEGRRTLQSPGGRNEFRRRPVKACLCATLLALLISMTLVACNRTPAANQSTAAKRYHLKGKVVSVDKRASMLNVDGEAIPGFMEAMTMPYQVKPASQLDKLAPGDAITADVVVQDDNSWLENIAVTGHSTPPAK